MPQPQSLPSLHAVSAELAEPVDGWLLSDFRGINPIMASVVGPEVVGSGRAYVYLPRNSALDHLGEHLSAGLETRGGDADCAARGVIGRYGYGDRIVPRTGHSIDRVGLHALGSTLDDTESFDACRIIPGVGFSVEPEIYIPGKIGVRNREALAPP